VPNPKIILWVSAICCCVVDWNPRNSMGIP